MVNSSVNYISEKGCKIIGPTFDVFMREYDYGTLDEVILGEGNRTTVRETCTTANRRILLKFIKF